jgi:hypothetical protein
MSLASVWYGAIGRKNIQNVEFWLWQNIVLEGDIAHRPLSPWDSAPSDFSLLTLHLHLVAFLLVLVLVLTEAK